jgi:hypothetical protein
MPPLQACPACVMFPGVAGAAETTLTAIDCADELPHVLLAVTEMVPPVDPAATTMDDVVEVPLHPFGRVHVYEVAPFTEVTENVLLELELHTLAGPVIAPGIAGTAPKLTASVCADELPQKPFAVIEIVPPLAPTVAVMLSVIELPVHEPGRDQV